jgi:hypothetical protein
VNNPTPRPASPEREGTTPTKAAQQRQYRKDVLAGAEANHIWLNAFSCIRPTDELLMALGRQVLAYLENPGATHQSLSGYLLDLPMREVVIRVNKS